MCFVAKLQTSDRASDRLELTLVIGRLLAATHIDDNREAEEAARLSCGSAEILVEIGVVGHKLKLQVAASGRKPAAFLSLANLRRKSNAIDRVLAAALVFGESAVMERRMMKAIRVGRRRTAAHVEEARATDAGRLDRVVEREDRQLAAVCEPRVNLRARND